MHRRDAIVSRYLEMTRRAIQDGARFIIWPESSLPVYFEEDLVRASGVRRLARDHKVTLLIGSDQVERSRPDAPVESLDNRFFNAAFLVTPDGTITEFPLPAMARGVGLTAGSDRQPPQRLANRLWYADGVGNKLGYLHFE